jgi:hypothetical protein
MGILRQERNQREEGQEEKATRNGAGIRNEGEARRLVKAVPNPGRVAAQ